MPTPTDTPIPPTNTPLPTPTHAPPPTATFTPTATPSPSRVPVELEDRALRAYGLTLLIQLNAKGTHEIAEGLVSEELSSFQAGVMRFAIASLIQAVEEAISQLDPPEGLVSAWEQALDVHERTKEVMRRWFAEEIDSTTVVEEIAPILADAEEAASDAEEQIARAYDVARAELITKRDQVLREFEEIFSGTAEP
jgi:hypothetical protein